MALTTQPQRVTFARTMGLAATPIEHGVEKASSTYVAGAFVIDDDAGRMTESTSPIDVGAVARRCIGMACNAATGTTGKDVPIVMATGQTIFEGTLSDLSAGTHTLAQADQWQTFAITKGTANWYLDANAKSDAGGGMVIGFKDAIGTVDGRVYFIVTSPARGGANASSAQL